MSHCPSHDWDRHIADLDDEAEAQAAFCRLYQAQIIQVAAALAPSMARLNEVESGRCRTLRNAEEIAQVAAEIVRACVDQGLPP